MSTQRDGYVCARAQRGRVVGVLLAVTLTFGLSPQVTRADEVGSCEVVQQPPAAAYSPPPQELFGALF